MQALVTGGSGFIGSEVIRQLTAQGIKVRALLRETSPKYNLAGLEYEAVIGDLANKDALCSAVQGVDYIFHIAGVIIARTQGEYFKHNTQGTANLAQACIEVNPKLKRFIYVSSISASGPSDSSKPKIETDPPNPQSAYGASKLNGEYKLEKVAEKFPVTIVRPPPVYGPRDRGILQFVRLVKRGVVPVYPAKTAEGEKYYSMIHVEDLVQGIVLAGLNQNQKQMEVFFLCGDGIYSWSQIMQAMAEKLGTKPRQMPLPIFAWKTLACGFTLVGKIFGKGYPLTLDKLNDLAPDYWICSNDRAKTVLGFKPQWGLKEGLAQTIDWYQKQGWV